MAVFGFLTNVLYEHINHFYSTTWKMYLKKQQSAFTENQIKSDERDQLCLAGHSVAVAIDISKIPNAVTVAAGAFHGASRATSTDAVK